MDSAPVKARTRESYLKVIGSAIRHSTRLRTTDWEQPAMVQLTQVVQDLIARKDISQATKLTTRSALLWYIRSGETPASEDADQAKALLDGMERKKGPRFKERPKNIPETDLAKLLDEIYQRADRSDWASRCAIWIVAGLACGARPIEWLDTEWDSPEKTALRIRNAKIKLDKPAYLRNSPDADDHQPEPGEEGEFRLVPIAKESDRSMIDTQIELIRTHAPQAMSRERREEEFAAYYKQVRKVLDRACRKIWGGKKMYSLYTMRKQFSANMRAALGSGKTASLMGHSREDSPAAAAYGKGNQAHLRFRKGSGAQLDRQWQGDLSQPAEAQEAPIGPVE